MTGGGVTVGGVKVGGVKVGGGTTGCMTVVGGVELIGVGNRMIGGVICASAHG
jgi:hypothetical protein